MEGCRDAGRAILTQRVVYEAHARERDRVCWAADVVDEDDATRWCEVTDRAAGQTAKLQYHLALLHLRMRQPFRPGLPRTGPMEVAKVLRV